jgi:hypothetical protein
MANRPIGLLSEGIGWDHTCRQSLCLRPFRIVVHFLNNESCCWNKQAQRCSNYNRGGREGDPQPRHRLQEEGEHKEQGAQDEIPTS